MNLRKLSSLIVALCLQSFRAHTPANSPPQPRSLNETMPATVTWVRISTAAAKSTDRQCTGCASHDYDEPEERRLAPRRRRNKKPTSQRRRSSTRHRPRKKYSTRVPVDEASVKFAAHPQETAAAATLSGPLPTPARYLLPPFATGSGENSDLRVDTNGWAAAAAIGGRGATKFKDTLQRQQQQQQQQQQKQRNELDSSAPLPPSLAEPATNPTIDESVAKPPRRPIVVPPVAAQDHSVSISGGFVSPEVAKITQQQQQQQTSPARATQQQLGDGSAVNEWAASRNEGLPRRAVERTSEMAAPASSFWWPPTATDSAQPPDISHDRVHDGSAALHEPKNDEEPAARASPDADSDSDSDFDDTVGRVHRPAAGGTPGPEYSSRQPGGRRESHARASATRGPPAVFGHGATSYSPPPPPPPATNSSADRSKGLRSAESSYFPRLPSRSQLAELAARTETDVIPGIAGKDYPIYSRRLLRKRKFSCRGLEGYFADISTRCQVFYICNGNGAGEPVLCPNGTLFSQELLVCDWWYNVDC